MLLVTRFKVSSQDLGVILGEGFVAENKDIHDKLVCLNIVNVIPQEELFVMFDYCCDPGTSYEAACSSQIISGIISVCV